MASESELGAYINGLTAETSPDASNDYLLIRDATDGGLKKISVSEIAGAAAAGIDPSGWQAADAMTYASADDPTFTATCTGDQSAKYSVGMRIKLTQSTGGTKYFIITAVAVSTDTTLTLYGGTDYNLENEAISNPYYSVCKAPVGFPLDPNKWMVEVTDTTNAAQATPTQNVWYNLGTIVISIPIGVWRVTYQVTAGALDASAGIWQHYVTLSTANNSESDADCTYFIRTASTTVFAVPVHREKTLVLAAKTSYYLNAKTGSSGQDTLEFRGDQSKTIIRAVCAYL